MIDIKKIADEADMILNGYVYTRKQNIIQVLNLNDPRVQVFCLWMVMY